MRIPHSAVEEQNAEAGPSTPRSNGGSRHQQPSSQPGTSDDVAFARTAEFLNGLMHAPRITEYRKRETDELVERCYFNCWRRDTHLPNNKLLREPDCTAWCYTRIKREGKKAKRAMAESSKEFQLFGKTKAPEEDDSRYRFSLLEDRYIFKARGQMAIAKYMEDEAEATRLYELERKLATAPPPPVMTRAEKIVLASKQRKAPIPDYEVLYPLGSTVASRLHRFEKHLIRIYGPTYNALKRIPTLWSDGVVQKTSWQIYESAVSGDGLVLGQRLLGVAQDTYKRWRESANREGGSGGPSLFPRPPPRDGGRSSGDSSEGTTAHGEGGSHKD